MSLIILHSEVITLFCQAVFEYKHIKINKEDMQSEDSVICLPSYFQ